MNYTVILKFKILPSYKSEVFNYNYINFVVHDGYEIFQGLAKLFIELKSKMGNREESMVLLFSALQRLVLLVNANHKQLNSFGGVSLLSR